MASVAKDSALRTPAEEIASAAIQGLAAVLGLVGLIVVVDAAIPLGTLPVASAAVYGGTLVLAFLASALYHGIRHQRAKRVLRAIDHCTIYLLIAGTYTPIALLVVGDGSGWALTAAVWTLALAGIVLRLGWPGLHRLRIVLYLALGWLVVAWGGPVFDGLGPAGSGLLVAGGLAYTAGIAFYLWERLPFNQAVWHLFVVTGSACFFAVVAFFALRTPAV